MIDHNSGRKNRLVDLFALCKTESGPFLRPFQPNAKWQSAEVFIVGTNPARPIGPEDCSYERFMDSLTGDGKLFQRIYASKGKFNEPMSKTSEKLNALVKRISANVIITNVYWTPTPSRVQLRKSQQNATPFLALLNYVKPRVVIVHGKAAADVMTVDICAPVATQTNTMQFLDATYQTQVFAYPHFSGLGWPKGFQAKRDDFAQLAARTHHALIP